MVGFRRERREKLIAQSSYEMFVSQRVCALLEMRWHFSVVRCDVVFYLATSCFVVISVFDFSWTFFYMDFFFFLFF